MTDEEIAFAIREYALCSLVHACAKKTLSGAYLGIAEAEFDSEFRPPGRDSLRPAGAALVSTISAAPSGGSEVDR